MNKTNTNETTSISLNAHAKINVGLDIIRKRADGYHELNTVMQTVGLHDTVSIKKTNKHALKLTCNLPSLPTDERNLVYSAAAYLIDTFRIDSGVSISLVKRIPCEAGLGGGSTDCATTLIAMKHLFNLPVTNYDLIRLGKRFGADVSYCLMRGTVLAKGIGERLKRLPPHPNVFLLLAKPPEGVSTADVYRNLVFTPETVHPDIDAIVTGIRNKDILEIAAALGNTLEDVTASLCPAVRDLKRIMLENHAIAAQMSGSGTAVFGYFRTRERMYQAKNAIMREMPEVKEVFCSYIYNISRSSQ